MGRNYFALAFSAAMLPKEKVVIVKTEMTLEKLRDEMMEKIKNGVKINCILNPSHKATIEVIKDWGIPVEIPQSPPRVELGPNDVLYLVQVSGLPRLTDRHQYTTKEIQRADWRFMKIEVFTDSLLMPLLYPAAVALVSLCFSVKDLPFRR